MWDTPWPRRVTRRGHGPGSGQSGPLARGSLGPYPCGGHAGGPGGCRRGRSTLPRCAGHGRGGRRLSGPLRRLRAPGGLGPGPGTNDHRPPGRPRPKPGTRPAGPSPAERPLLLRQRPKVQALPRSAGVIPRATSEGRRAGSRRGEPHRTPHSFPTTTRPGRPPRPARCEPSDALGDATPTRRTGPDGRVRHGREWGTPQEAA